MAVRRKDGRIRILGRVGDVLNLGGQKIAIEPFEKAARDLLGVDSLCVFSLAGGRWQGDADRRDRGQPVA